MITFFTSLKPLSGMTALQQRNALRSWRAVVPDCEIIVYGELKDGEDLIAEVMATYRPNIACNEFGTPLINAMFADAQRTGRYSTVCYINGDIILLPDFYDAIKRLGAWKMFSAVGQRWDLDWVETLEFGTNAWEERLRAAVAASGQRHGYLGMDIFAFRRGAIGPLPEFAIGRPAWDNYLIKYLLRHHIPIVDVSRVVTLIHQNHDYAHVAKRKGDAWEGPEADRNRGLATQEFGKFNPRYYTIKNAHWIMFNRFIAPAVSPRRALWRIMARAVSDRNRDTASNYWYSLQYLFRNFSYLLRSCHKLVRFWDLYVSILPLSFSARDPRAIAVVRVDSLGDFILWLDGARAIRARYLRPDYHVVLIASHEWCAFAETLGLFDEVLSVDAARYFADRRYRRKTSRGIARRRFATAVNPTIARDAWIDDCLIRATCASSRLGHFGDIDTRRLNLAKKFTDRWYTQQFHGTSVAMHEIEKNWCFAQQFDPDLELRGPALASRAEVRSAGQDYFVLFPETELAIKQWPIERFAEIAKRIHTNTGWSAIICGFSSDTSSAERLIAHANGVPIRNVCGRSTLQEVTGIIAAAKLVVTGDGSAVHLTAALERPVVAIVGGGQFGRFLPYPKALGSASQMVRAIYHSMPCYQCSWRCVHPLQPDEPAPCISSVSVDDVWTVIEPMIYSNTSAGSLHKTNVRLTEDLPAKAVH